MNASIIITTIIIMIPTADAIFLRHGSVGMMTVTETPEVSPMTEGRKAMTVDV